jgi:hypothetical protein
MVSPIAVPLKAKEKNYTAEMETEMEERYLANPTRETVNQIAKDFGKGERSVISKLSNMGKYIVPKRTTKSGTAIVKKSTLVEQIGKHFDTEYPSLEKANKIDLQKLLKDLNDFLGEADEDCVAE